MLSAIHAARDTAFPLTFATTNSGAGTFDEFGLCDGVLTACGVAALYAKAPAPFRLPARSAHPAIAFEPGPVTTSPARGRQATNAGSQEIPAFGAAQVRSTKLGRRKLSGNESEGNA